MSKPLLIVVDDDPGIAEIVQFIAEEIGFYVLYASNGKAFQKIWHKNKPSAIVTDIVMPTMDGHELLRWLVEQGCTAPILLMSGFDGKYIHSAETLGKLRGANVVGMLNKPFGTKQLESQLQLIFETISLWTDDMSVGVDVIDADHKVLFQTLLRLRKLATTSDDSETLDKALADLRDYTDYHFKREEALMEACEYPNLPSHKKVHDKIVSKVEEFIQENLVEPSILVMNELIDYLESWLQGHIKGMDKDYQEWMDGKDEIILKTNRDFQEKIGAGKIVMPKVA